MIKKGWKRLLIVLSVIWFVAASAFVIVERQSINPFDQFDKPPPQYVFWQWSPVDLLLPKEQQKRELNPKLNTILLTLSAPVVSVWFIFWAFAWVKDGFN
jgi:hypothetical protein